MAQPKQQPPEGRPVQWRDLSVGGRRIMDANVRETGENLPKIAHQAAETFAATHERTGNPKPRVQAESAAAVAPELVSKPVTRQTAANARQKLYNAGMEDRRAKNPDDPHQVIPTGAGWYFEHHRDIHNEAQRHGFPTDWAVAASGVMSPQNNPEGEKIAVGAMMDALANRKVTVTPDVHAHLAKRGIDVSEHLHQTVTYDQLPSGSLAHLSDAGVRSRVQTDANLHAVARGGTKENIAKAERVLMGEVHPDEAVNPHSAPKVWSYVHNIRQAVPNSPTHVEYMGRVHQDALVRSGQIDKHQQALDLYGHNEQKLPDEHLLSPNSHTVEDTWMNSVTYDQPKTMARGKTSTFKAAGSLPQTYPVSKTRVNEETGKKESAHPSGAVKPAATTHAFNNNATQKAAAQQGRQSGVTLPPQAVQEVSWVQVRKDAGKDAEFNRQEPEKADPLGGHVRGQLALFGPDVPGGERSRSSHLSGHEDLPTNVDPESDMRKHTAIFNNRQRSRLHRGTPGERDLTQ